MYVLKNQATESRELIKNISQTHIVWRAMLNSSDSMSIMFTLRFGKIPTDFSEIDECLKKYLVYNKLSATHLIVPIITAEQKMV